MHFGRSSGSREPSAHRCPLQAGSARAIIGSLSHRVLLVSPIALLLLWGSAARVCAAPAPVSPALADYLAGLDALAEARWADAVGALTRVRQASGSDPAFALALGVAHALSEQFPQALAELQGARRLGLKGREAELWIYAVETMSGTATPEHAPPGPRSLQGQPGARAAVSIPGHMIQGREDYPTDYASFVYYQMATPYGRARAAGATQAAGLRQAMAEAGRWFANRARTRPDLVPAHLARARELHGARQYRAALATLDFVRAVDPGDPTAAYYVAESWLALGRLATAQREFTLALTTPAWLAPTSAGRWPQPGWAMHSG